MHLAYKQVLTQTRPAGVDGYAGKQTWQHLSAERGSDSYKHSQGAGLSASKAHSGE